VSGRNSPFLGVISEEIVTPETLHHLLAGHSELGSVHLKKRKKERKRRKRNVSMPHEDGRGKQKAR
jgi:hypothetical protein